jgi:hypothetical protein
MDIVEGRVSSVTVDTQVRRKTSSQGRSRTTQRHTTLIDLDDHFSGEFSGSTGIKEGDQVVIVSQTSKAERQRILAFRNLSQNQQGPARKDIREGFTIAGVVVAVGLIALLAGLPWAGRAGSTTALIAGLAIVLYGLYTAKPSLEQRRALNKLDRYVAAEHRDR